LPVGLHLIGRRGEDLRLLEVARWLEGLVAH
jgi:Asp-tRNA(Asn)/Glu-tRNA(Gln) amidotransferase A subunit family amidase